MKSIRALSHVSRAADWLAHTRTPRILHVFDDACNLMNERREVLSVVTPQIGNGPFNLVVAEDICFSDYLNVESHIFLSPDQLDLGDLIIRMTNMKLWDPRPDWKLLHTKADEILDQIKHLPITNCQFPDSLGSRISSAIINSDIPAATKLASQLAGLGIGLTPSGDDFMMGAIYAAWVLHPPEIAAVMAQKIVDTAAPLTTSLSAAWLKSAGRGEGGILWHEFFEALLSANTSGIHQTRNNILAVGETSGADALAGFTAVFVSWMEKVGYSHG